MIQTSKQSSIEKFQDMACCHGKVDKKISQISFLKTRQTDSQHNVPEPTFATQMTQEKVEEVTHPFTRHGLASPPRRTIVHQPCPTHEQ
jgi:hypothetical protein